jgi:hypothetical protein
MLKKRALSQSREIMTLPDERYRAVIAARDFLQDLCDPKQTPRISKTVRARARAVLRHYPGSWDLDRAASAAPEVFQQRMEPLYRMIKVHEQQQVDKSEESQ